MTLWMLSNLALAGVRVCVGLVVIRRVLRAGGRWQGRDWGVVLVALSALVVAWPDPLAMALEAGWMTLCAVRLWHCDGRMSLFVATFVEIALALWHFILAVWLGVAFADAAFLDTATASGQAALWLVHGLALVLVLTLRKRALSRRVMMKGFAVFFLVSLLALISLDEQQRLAIDGETIDLWLMMVLILMIGVLVANLRSQLDTERELAVLRAAQAESSEREYQRLSQTYAANARLFHDLHNHLGVLRHLIAQEKTAAAADYLDSLQAPLAALTVQHWIGDGTVDHLIAVSQQQCEAAGIRFEAAVEFPAHTNLRSADLCALLGNLLDNAREGAMQAEGEPFLRLVMRRIGMMLVIKVENSACPPRDDLVTTKTDGLHGWGLTSARTAVARYDGVVQTNYADGVFTAVATLSFEAIGVDDRR